MKDYIKLKDEYDIEEILKGKIFKDNINLNHASNIKLYVKGNYQQDLIYNKLYLIMINSDHDDMINNNYEFNHLHIKEFDTYFEYIFYTKKKEKENFDNISYYLFK